MRPYAVTNRASEIAEPIEPEPSGARQGDHLERVDDAEDGAEQADEWRRRSRGSDDVHSPIQVTADRLAFALERAARELGRSRRAVTCPLTFQERAQSQLEKGRQMIALVQGSLLEHRPVGASLHVGLNARREGAGSRRRAREKDDAIDGDGDARDRLEGQEHHHAADRKAHVVPDFDAD